MFDPDPALTYPATPLRRAARRSPGRSSGLVIRGCFQTRIREGKPCGKGKPGSPALQTPSRRGGLAAPCRRSGAAAPGGAGGPGHKGKEQGADRAGARPAGSERAAAARRAVLPCPARRDGAEPEERTPRTPQVLTTRSSWRWRRSGTGGCLDSARLGSQWQQRRRRAGGCGESAAGRGHGRPGRHRPQRPPRRSLLPHSCGAPAPPGSSRGHGPP